MPSQVRELLRITGAGGGGPRHQDRAGHGGGRGHPERRGNVPAKAPPLRISVSTATMTAPARYCDVVNSAPAEDWCEAGTSRPPSTNIAV